MIKFEIGVAYLIAGIITSCFTASILREEGKSKWVWMPLMLLSIPFWWIAAPILYQRNK
jgi:hypothetical protein